MTASAKRANALEVRDLVDALRSGGIDAGIRLT